MIRTAAVIAAFVLLHGQTVPRAGATVSIQINYSGPAQFQTFFDDAADLWESLLVDYVDGFVIATTSGSSQAVGVQMGPVVIGAQLQAIDGPGNVLGSAGPTELALDSSLFRLTTDGVMTFDTADASNLATAGVFDDVVRHEMAHVLGFGTLWDNNGVYVNGTGEYLGAAATAFWQNEFGQSGAPDVELGGGPGTADGHWDEVDGGVAATGITDGAGNDLRNELMTGWLNTPTFISQMTIASFKDIGFDTVIAAIPELSGSVTVGLAFAVAAFPKRRR